MRTQIRLETHQAAFQNLLQPPRIAITRWVTVVEGDHWFWKPSAGAERHRRFSPEGQAIWSWRPTRERVRRPRGIFVVARLLLQYDRGPYPPRTQFTNTCGLSQCVNPEHWEPLIKPPVYMLLGSAAGMRLYLRRTGRPVAGSHLVVVRIGNVTHVVSFPGVPTFDVCATCGCVVYLANAVIMATGTLVTCKGGC